MTEVTSEPRVHMRHIRAAKLCSRGTRQWFEAHGVGWTEFLASGVPASVLENTGDPLALRAVVAAKAEHNGR